MKIISLFFCIVVLVASILAAATISSAFQMPTPWPPRHTHTEIEWDVTQSPQSGQIKNFYYDFPNRDLKVVGNYAFGPAIDKLASITSIWKNTSLYIETVITIGDATIPNCVNLDLGFGMMMPDWMLENIQYMGNMYDARRGFDNSTGLNDNNYYNVTWTSNPVGGPFPPFNYYAKEDGSPFKMWAPAMTPQNLVVNEYPNAFVPVDSFVNGTFELPASCQKTNQTAAAAAAAFKDEESMYKSMRKQKVFPRVITERVIQLHKNQIAQFKTMALQKQPKM